MKKGILSIFPKNIDFFGYLKNCIEVMEIISKELLNFIDNPTEENFNKIRELEHKADEIVHEYRYKLNESFITPLDREDLHQIIMKMDDVIDFIKSSAEKYYLYKPNSKNEYIRQMINLLIQAVGYLKEIVNLLNKPNQELLKLVNKICEIERECDVINRKAIAELFNNGQNVLEVIKQKEILSQVEETVDRTQLLAITIENSVYKHI
jgi:predicted phosphate transport protein (TIGR00153 family)